jgi:hypothetical protein
MADYKWLVLNQIVRRLADGASIPNDAGNKDWKAFQDWLAIQGNVPDPADPPPTAAQILADEIAGAVDQFLNSSASISKVERSAALVTMDRVNIIHKWLMDFKAATAAATSLANLQARVAALDTLPQFQSADIKTAIQNKITSGAGN